jgi:hypothetical protein
MRTAFLGTALCFLFASPALAWNEKGHMIVAKLSWLKLDDRQREAVTKILKTHPHYQEFLVAECPATSEEDEWAFMRAAFWPDWIRSHHSAEYSKPTWHYVTAGFVPPYSKLNATDLPSESPNVVTQISASIDKVRTGTADEKAIYLCWLLHLVGDIHQPLHCCSLLSEAFPQGDKGGNLALVRINGGRPTRLHPMWDGLLGKPVTPKSIATAVAEVEDTEQTHAAEIEQELDAHATPVDWAQEGFELAKMHAYLSGDLRPANDDEKPAEDQVPNIAESYAQTAGRVARVQMAKAGRRLATSVQQAIP